jgi:hypothetical protein
MRAPAYGSVSFGYVNTPGATASLTGSIAAASAIFDGSINNNELFVDSIATGDIAIGSLLAGAGVAAETRVIAQLAGTPGWEGIYAVDIPLQEVAPTTITASFGVLTVTAIDAPVLCPGVELEGVGIAPLTNITAPLRRR